MLHSISFEPCNESALFKNCESCKANTFSDFKDLSLNTSTDLNAQMKREFSPNESLISDGEIEKGIYCISQGLVKITKKGNNDSEFIPWIARSGDLVGFSAIFGEVPASFSAIAITPVEACFISSQLFISLLTSKSMAFNKLFKGICRSLNTLDKRILSLSDRSKSAILAEILLMSINDTTVNMPKGIPIIYSRNDLAALIGTTKNYINKMLAELVEKEIVSMHNRRVFINNKEALTLEASGLTNNYLREP